MFQCRDKNPGYGGECARSEPQDQNGRNLLLQTINMKEEILIKFLISFNLNSRQENSLIPKFFPSMVRVGGKSNPLSRVAGENSITELPTHGMFSINVPH